MAFESGAIVFQGTTPCIEFGFTDGKLLDFRRLGGHSVTALRLPLPPLLLQRKSLRFEVHTQGVQPGDAVIERPLHADLLGIPSGLLFFQGLTLGIQFGLPDRELFGFHGLGGQRLAMLRFPLQAFVGQRRSRGLEFPAKLLQFGRLGRIAFGSFRLLSFPAGLLLLQRLALGIQFGLPGRKLLGFRGPGDQRLAMLRFPLQALLGQRCSRGLDFSANTLQFGRLGRIAFGSFRFLSFPGGLLFFQRLTLGIQFGLPGRKLLGFRGPVGQCLAMLQFPLAAFFGQRCSRGLDFPV